MQLIIIFTLVYSIQALTDLNVQFVPARRRSKSSESAPTDQKKNPNYKPDNLVLNSIQNAQNYANVAQTAQSYANLGENKDTDMYTMNGYTNVMNKGGQHMSQIYQKLQNLNKLGVQASRISLGNRGKNGMGGYNSGHVSSLRRSEGSDIYQRPPQETQSNNDFSPNSNSFLESITQNIQNYFNKNLNPENSLNSMSAASATNQQYGNNFGQIPPQLSQMPDNPSKIDFINSMSNLFGVSSSSPDAYANNMFGAQNGQGLEGQGPSQSIDSARFSLGNGDLQSGNNNYQSSVQETQSPYSPNSIPDMSMTNGNPNLEQAQNFGPLPDSQTQNIPPQNPDQAQSMTFSNFPMSSVQNQASNGLPTNSEFTQTGQNSWMPSSFAQNSNSIYGPSKNIMDTASSYKMMGNTNCLACQLKRACQPSACCCQCQQVCERKCFACQQPQQLTNPWSTNQNNDDFWNNYGKQNPLPDVNSISYPNSINPVQVPTNVDNPWDAFSTSFRSYSNGGQNKIFQFINPFNNQPLSCEYAKILQKKMKKSAV